MSGLVGREREVERLDALFEDGARLVTLVGPGGVGKTTLALHAAFGASTLPRVASLAPVQRADSVGIALAECLGVESLDAGAPAGLGDDALLVVDNCEHVLDAVAACLEPLLSSVPELRVLATSREPLGLPQERVLPLPPLALPEPDDADAIAASPAVALFLDRAEAAGARLERDARSLTAVAALCRRLDGLPLAIELAASRARAITPAEMLERLSDDGSLLVSRGRPAEPRHRTLYETIRWSYELLDPDEQRLFEALSVYPGTFSLHAAEFLAQRIGLDPGAALDVLERLVGRSLVVAQPLADTTWYHLLETLSAFGRARLAERDALTAARDACADYARALALESWQGVLNGVSTSQLTRIFLSADLMREAVLWCLEHDREPTRAFELVVPLWAVATQAHAREIESISRRVLEHWPDPSIESRPLALASWSATLGMQGASGEARDAALTAIRLEQELVAPGPLYADGLAELVAARGLASGCVRDGDAEGLQWIERAIEVARRVAPSLLPELVLIRAELSSQHASRDQSLEGIREGLALAEKHGVEYATSWGLVARGWVRRSVEPETAQRDFEAALELGQRLGFALGVGHSIQGLGSVAMLRGDDARSADHALAAIGHWRRSGDPGHVWAAVREGAVLLAHAGEAAVAEETLACREVRELANAPWGDDLACLEQASQRIDVALSASEREQARRVGAERSGRETIDRLSERLRALARPEAPTSPAQPTAAPAPNDPCVFREDGDLWLLAFAGERHHLAGRKGLHDIARLLARPNEAVHCLELAGRAAETDAGAEVFDERALREIRARATELREAQEEASARGDGEAADRARGELEALEDALAGSLGLGGRTRKLGSEAERARSAVTARIRAAMKQVEEVHPSLGRHLRASVRTGTWCVYAPEHEPDWELAAG